MRCSSYGLMIPGSDSRFYLSTTSKKPDPFLRFRRISNPTRIQIGSVKTRATGVNDGLVKEVVSEMSFYELLGIPESGSLPDIKQAYKQLARKYHPDVSPPGRVEEYTQCFIRVQEAYETLSDPRRKAMYDRDMAKGLHLAFSARRRYQYDEGICSPPHLYLAKLLWEAKESGIFFVESLNQMDMEERGEWKNRWQSQVSELKRRSTNKDARGNMSWGARMRRQRDELSHEL